MSLAPHATPGSNRLSPRRQAVAPLSRVTVRTKRRVRFDDADDIDADHAAEYRPVRSPNWTLRVGTTVALRTASR